MVLASKHHERLIDLGLLKLDDYELTRVVEDDIAVQIK